MTRSVLHVLQPVTRSCWKGELDYAALATTLSGRLPAGRRSRMNNPDATVEARRRFIALVGGGALLTPFLGLAGCGGKEEAPVQAAPASSSSSSAEPQITATRPESPQASANGAIPRLSEDDPQARSLAYVHNADDVIASEQARYEQGQACSNCQLYQGTANDEWAGCPLFAGKLVKGTGWCTAYASRSG
jgi:hypothetical protein